MVPNMHNHRRVLGYIQGVFFLIMVMTKLTGNLLHRRLWRLDPELNKLQLPGGGSRVYERQRPVEATDVVGRIVPMACRADAPQSTHQVAGEAAALQWRERSRSGRRRS